MANQFDIQRLLNRMTIEEKAALCSGSGFWHSQGIEAIGLSAISMSDGPHGLRKQQDRSDNIGLEESVQSTCFPSGGTIACSWDESLIYAIGEALAEECLEQGVSMLLGPGINIKRSPLCGRNFEYFSEDPYVSGILAAAYINGLQSKGIYASIKHFAVNNQEHRRMTIDTIVDDRALREIYLKGFELAIKASKPATVMAAYNKVNGTYCCEHPVLLKQILRDEWGYNGIVVSDWGAVNDRVEGLRTGLDLEMPSSGGQNDRRVRKSLKKGSLDRATLDDSTERMLRFIFDAKLCKDKACQYDREAHHRLAYDAAVASTVLLKNDRSTLPIDDRQTIGIIGEFAKKPRYQGSGSSKINPYRVDSLFDALKSEGIQFIYEQGYDSRTDMSIDPLAARAVVLARSVDVPIIVAGLTNAYESEGFDRHHMLMPYSHVDLINAVADVNPNTVVILQNGAPIAMPWIDKVHTVIEAHLGGEAGGEALADIILGKVNPSGKLTETIPICFEDTPSYRYFSMGPKYVEYRESIYVGYRYYEKKHQSVLFPFGHGLSYTSYIYSELNLSQYEITSDETLKVTMTITNVGGRAGAEVVQLYIGAIKPIIHKPVKELKRFKKVFLEKGASKTVEFELTREDFSYYNVVLQDWHVESGYYDILIGSSSRDIWLKERIIMDSLDNQEHCLDYRNGGSVYYDMTEIPGSKGPFRVSDSSYEKILGYKIPHEVNKHERPYTVNSTMFDIRSTVVGWILHKIVTRIFMTQIKDDEDGLTRHMVNEMIDNSPVRALVLLSGGRVSFGVMESLLMMMNRKPFSGFFNLIRYLYFKRHTID